MNCRFQMLQKTAQTAAICGKKTILNKFLLEAADVEKKNFDDKNATFFIFVGDRKVFSWTTLVTDVAQKVTQRRFT